MVNCRHAGKETLVEQVQVTDLENAAYLPKPTNIQGMLPGIDNWRRPEGHLRGELNKTHIFFFKVMVFGREHYQEPWRKI
jgi:hypothetical protein